MPRNPGLWGRIPLGFSDSAMENLVNVYCLERKKPTPLVGAMTMKWGDVTFVETSVQLVRVVELCNIPRKSSRRIVGAITEIFISEFEKLPGVSVIHDFKGLPALKNDKRIHLQESTRTGALHFD